MPSGQLRRRLLVLKELIGRDHRDAIPWTNLVAQRAADAAGKVDRADLECRLVTRAWHGADAIDRADRKTCLTAGAHVFVEKGQCLGKLFLCHAE